MKLIWEVALAIQEQGLARDQLRFTPDLQASPYLEAAFLDLNTLEPDEGTLEINPLYRYPHLFANLFDPNLEDWRQLRDLLFDVYMHYQCQLDLRQGLSKDEFYIRAILRDILAGGYGAELAATALLFDNREMKRVLYCLLALYRLGPSMDLFRKAVRGVYPQASVYRNNDSQREILIHLPWPKNEPDYQKLDFLIALFLPVNYTVYVFWKHHFGVIGLDQTLLYDNMLIF